MQRKANDEDRDVKWIDNMCRKEQIEVENYDACDFLRFLPAVAGGTAVREGVLSGEG